MYLVIVPPDTYMHNKGVQSITFQCVRWVSCNLETEAIGSLESEELSILVLEARWKKASQCFEILSIFFLILFLFRNV